MSTKEKGVEPLSKEEIASIEKSLNVAAKASTQSQGASLQGSALLYSQMMGLFQRIVQVNSAFEEGPDIKESDQIE